MSPRRGLLAGAAALALLWSMSLPGAASAAPKAPTISFYFGLQRPESQARSVLRAVSEPGSDEYRHFLTMDQIRKWGAPAGIVKRFRAALEPRGLKVGLDPTRVFARVTGPLPKLEGLLGVPIRHSFDNDDLADVWFAAPGSEVRLPAKVKPLVRELVASYSRTAKGGKPAAGGSVSPGPGGAAVTGPQPGNTGTWSEGCGAARETGAYSFAQVRHAYGADAIPGAGAGGSLAILNVGEGAPPADVRANAACFDLAEPSVRTLLSDGQSQPFGRGSFEPQEDLALARALAPKLRSLIFTQAWLAPELWFLGAADLFQAPHLPDAFSISYGECEREIRGPKATESERAGADLMDAVLVRLGLAGVASFASAGDFGSTCNGRPFAGVAWPASSPYLTAVGGTRLTLDPANQRSDEVVWNDLPWLPTEEGGGAAGGGLAAYSARPPYQRKTSVPAEYRGVPDLSAHASMLPGWPIVVAGNWIEDAGTSSSAPLVAGAFAALSAAQRAAGQPPLGPVDYLVYKLQESNPATFFDITSGDNSYLAKVPAETAAPGYDLASGLGVPNFAALAQAVPPPGA